MAAPLALEALTIVGRGITRPEDVLVTPDGRIFVSNASAAVSELLADGSHRPIGRAGGEPTGLGLLPDGGIVIANFAAGCIQRLDLGTETVDVIANEIDGLPLSSANYPLVDLD